MQRPRAERALDAAALALPDAPPFPPASPINSKPTAARMTRAPQTPAQKKGGATPPGVAPPRSRCGPRMEPSSIAQTRRLTQ
jgi:hypothetical protein